MVIYEVNLEINPDIFNDYYQWLIEHVKKMLRFDGFQTAEIGLIDHQENEKQKIRVSYKISSYESLQTYLSEHAAEMRADAINKFGDQFSASRRIIKNPILFEKMSAVRRELA